MEDFMKYDSLYQGRINLGLMVGTYGNGSTFIQLYDFEDGYPSPFQNLTVDMDKELPAFYGYVDTVNLPHAEIFIRENHLGEFMGDSIRSAYAYFPLYRFYPERLKEIEEKTKNYVNKERRIA